MNKTIVALAVLVFIATVNARHFNDQSVSLERDESEVHTDHIRRARDHRASQMRHKRRAWQTNYGYEYPQPPNPYYPDNRRDYAPNNHQDLLPQIYRLLDEISVYLRRPQPPQPIYIPYPVPYPVVQQCRCQPKSKPAIQPNITSRFPVMEDSNQNWGFADTNQDDFEDEEGDGARPISFDPIVPKRPAFRPQPKVEHGSSQAGSYTTQAPRVIETGYSRCDLTSLSCCAGTLDQQQQCFNNAGCGSSFNNGDSCKQDRLLAIIDAFAKTYSPIVNN